MSSDPKIEKAPISAIKFDRANANKGSERGRYSIEASMREFGFADAGTLDKNNVIIGGNKRTEVAGEIGMDDAIVIDVDGTKPVYIRRKDLDLNDPDDDRARRLAYALNRSQELSLTWDAEQVMADIGAGLDLSAMFRQDELDELLADLTPKTTGDTEPQTDRAEELRQAWGVQPGQLWQLGEHRLICGDCTDAATVARVMGGEKSKLMVTDPPYGVEYDPNWRNEAAEKGLIAYAASSVGKVENDDRVDWSDAYRLVDAQVAYVWHADRHATQVQQSLEASGYVIVCQIIWAKPVFAISRGDYHWQHEPCWYAVKKGSTHNWQGSRSESTLWEIERGIPEKSGHGTEKPLECMARPIRNNTAEGEIVCDPFVGSGTSIIACENLRRRCRAVEISPAYVAVAIQRWADHCGGQPVLLD